MRILPIIAVAALAAFLSACAGSVSAPESIQPLASEQRADLQLSDISANADAGVEMSDADFGLICQKVRGYIAAETPGALANPSSPHAFKMMIHFTRFDRGSALARGVLIGLGQIRIEATVALVNSAGQTVAQYKVAKDFALGGVVGATTTVEDVEDGFAKSVAEVVKQP